jgi:hypothetical protein
MNYRYIISLLMLATLQVFGAAGPKYVGTFVGEASGATNINADKIASGTLSRPVATTGSVVASNFTGKATGLTNSYGTAFADWIYIPDPTEFTNSLVIGNGGQNLNRSAPNPVDPLANEIDGSMNSLLNTFIGINAGLTNDSGNHNVFVGTDSGMFNANGDQNTFIGSWAGKFNTSGYHNTFLGCGAGQDNTTGNYNLFIGTDSGLHNVSGSDNIFIGQSTGAGNSTGSNNVAIGNNSLGANTTGYKNTAIGDGTLRSVISGLYNVAIGANALQNQVINNQNVGIGYNALFGSTNGIGNVAVGGSALEAAHTGVYNVAVGVTSGDAVTGGTYNTLLGFGSDVATGDLTDTIAIGKNAVATADHQTVLGGPTTTETVIRGHLTGPTNATFTGNLTASVINTDELNIGDLNITNQWNADGATNVNPSGIVSGTFPGALYTTASTATNGPAANELITAQFVRDALSSGYYVYNSSNQVRGWFSGGPIFLYTNDVPENFFRGHTVYSNNQYVGAVAITNLQSQSTIRGPYTISMWIGYASGAGRAVTVKPEIYYSYDYGTNSFGDWDCGAQVITAGQTNLYTFTVDGPATTITNLAYLIRPLKIVSQSGTWGASQLYIAGGTTRPGHLSYTVSGASAGGAQLAANNNFTGLNVFSKSPASPTNLWALDTAFGVNTNALVLISGAVTGGITGVANLDGSGNVQFGEGTIKATGGDITFTNAAGLKANDYVTSRIITNGNYAEIAVKVVPGVVTNLAIVQFK